MDGADLWKIFVAAIGFGVGGEVLRRYRGFKARRRSTSRNVRNSGFWTDGRIYHAEAAFAALAFAIPFCIIVPALALDRPNGFLYSYAALIVYALLVYLLIRGMNMDEPQ